MIQRIQTIWFFFATLTFFALFLFAYVHFTENGTPKALKVTGVYENRNGEVVSTQDFLALTIVTALIGALPFIAIFLFKNRKQQITLAYIAIIAVLGHFFWLYYTTKQLIGHFQLQAENYGIGIILPSLTILFLIFAIKGIRKDERLIRSTDRLRG
jgi:heme/copper-type cytochrome/quinol oxidase subunit 3